MLSGPDWSDSHLEAPKLQWWLDGVKNYLNEVTVHYYGGSIQKDTNIRALLDDDRIVKKTENLKALIQVCMKNGGLPLRITGTRAATLSYGGIQGVSDTAGAALWALDISLEIAYTGAAGIHFHQVFRRDNNANYNALYYQAATQRVRVRLPLYGYLMLQQALAGGADILGRSRSGGCKVWLLKGRRHGDLRAVVISKADGKECAADMQLSADQMRRFSATADAQYMYSAGGLGDRWRIYYSDTFFELWGSAKARPAMTVGIKRYEKRDRSGKVTGGGFAVHLTRGTIAALVTVQPAGGGGQQAKGGASKSG